MYKVMLVDDEAVVRDGLKNTIDWAKHGFALIGDYANGREAWDAIEEAKPDLVISDISMPFMDGLELTGLIAASYPYIKVLILTGYDQFEYAQQAIRLKVTDFILKPITAAEIRTLLDRIRAEMDQEMQRREDLTRLHSQLHQSLPLLKERFLERLVALGLTRPEIEERFAYFGIPPASPPFLAIAADIDDFGDRDAHFSDAHDAEFLRFAAYNIFEETVQDREDVLLFRTREERMVAVLYGHDDESALYEQAFGVAEQLRHHVERFLGFTVTVGIGRPCASAEQLPQSYRGALSALDYRFLMGKNRVLGIADLEGEAAAAPLLADRCRRLAAAVRTGSSDEAYAHIEDTVRELKTSRLPIEACFLHMQKLVLTLTDAIQEMGIPTGSEALPLWLTDVYKFKTLDEIERWLKEIVAAMMDAAAGSRNRFILEQIGKATAYIEAHYASDKLTLQELCRHVLMSTSYFSQMFKQHTGETFVECLTRVRMDKAKTLLRTTPLKFYEIAAQVGYADPNYFSLLFKKHAGMTPRDFRDGTAEEAYR
ncbi:response regulator [Cohnella sp. JJ-181]|uniref:response regulator n=1 Tax=Cohnella rhizoplanae TaxID=2974897 RepID=UPI0022FF670D|nr:response regulator [Cohnella sp. JJ-181]CAI6082111.1 HTH-type transcriptional activator RhaR [Cohnella sp. JJ-181]